MNTLGRKLESTTNRVKTLAKVGMIIFFLAFTGVGLLAQKVMVQSDRVETSDDKEVKKYVQSSPLQSFNIEHKGTIEVTDDDRDIKSISPGGYIEISKTTFGSKRSILIEATSNGLRREYYENRTKIDFEPAGRKWLAEILPDVVRSTGIAAESRVNRFYKKGGVDAVTDEISNLESDYVKAIYGKILLKKDGLSTTDLAKAVKVLSDEIDSDYYLAEMLKDNSERFLKNNNTAEAYFDAVTHIGSDYYSTVVLKEALQNHKPSAAEVAKIMQASRNIGSDYYQASILSYVLDQDDLQAPVLAEVIATTKNISSDYYQSQVLSKALSKQGMSGESFNAVLEAISDVSSDYYMASVFSKLLESRLDDNTNAKLISLVKEKMSSDYYAASVLGKMLKNQNLSERSFDQLAQTLSEMGSSNYAASVIKTAAESGDLSKTALLSLVKASASISSDYYMASALESLAPHVKNSDSEVKEAYRSAAKNIDSDTYYGQAIRAID